MDEGLPYEKVRWTITFMADPESKEGWCVTFLDTSSADYEDSVSIREPGEGSNG
jgi:hypothetical protein